MSTWKAKFEKKQQDQKDAEVAKKVEVNDISFPSLSTESAWGTNAGAAKPKDIPKKSFASMAAEWKETDEIEKNRREMAAEQSHHELRHRSEFTGSGGLLYNFGGTHSRREDTYYEDEYAGDYVPPPTADTSDDWRTCERKVRRRAPKSVAERILADEKSERVEDTAVWQEPYHEETVWNKY